MITEEIYLLHLSKDGKTHKSSHWVWDKQKFIASQVAAAEKEGGMVQQITREKFDEGRRGSSHASHS